MVALDDLRRTGRVDFDMIDQDANLRAGLGSLEWPARDKLRPVLIRDRSARDEIAMQLLRYRDAVGSWPNDP
jgi:hypothetical protein